MDRDILIERLSQDLIGPFEEFEEIRDARPSDVYLTGILWPKQSEVTGEEDDRLDSAGTEEGTEGPSPDDEQVPPAVQLRPSVAGVSFAVYAPSPHAPSLYISVTFGTYMKSEIPAESEKTSAGLVPVWKRRPHHIKVGPITCPPDPMSISLAETVERNFRITTLTDSEIPKGVRVHIRSVPWGDNHLVTVTLVNESVPDPEEGRVGREQSTFFQTAIRVEPAENTVFVARPSRRSVVDEEDRSLALLYRKAREFAVGHTCSADWDEFNAAQLPSWVGTTWLPTSIVQAVSSSGHEVFEPMLSGDNPNLSLDWLIGAKRTELADGLQSFVNAYLDWIELKNAEIEFLPDEFLDPAKRNITQCREAVDRMLAGVNLVRNDERIWQALRLAFIAIRLQHDWSRGESEGQRSFVWRPFQLGFILLAIPSVSDRQHSERNIMDLLWFPTGGGKTEAYLALVAFTAFYRRLSGGDDEGGVSAVMRYTLRLLTTQQFARAAAVILACEAIRRGEVAGASRVDLGRTPFSIGLWAGEAATPNNYENARKSLQGSLDVSSPKQLAFCPACGIKLRWNSDDSKRAVLVACDNNGCTLHDGGNPLPVWTVDDDIYRECPTLLIGTVDKFAQIIRRKQVNHLFCIQSGSPPDLIIQDELHLISGPLGTVAGLYETAIDLMFSRNDRKPKIIGSTATIRRASEQVRSLFDRALFQFPPPALDADDSGFAVSLPVSQHAPGRRYAAVTTAGRSAKFILQAVSASLLQSASILADRKSRDYYGTLVSYFNSLRELGGALVLMQDDVNDSLNMYAWRHGENPRELENIQELTSRRTQAEIREMLDMLEIPADYPGTLDAVLATNMLSVGVDIPRLGLMVVNGQPKGISEYIQATSRIGRGDVPGLVVTALNNAKARDRSHFETFRTWHETLYRDVEATSVTPFASRARDRALHAVLVALCRHKVASMFDRPRIDEDNEQEVMKIVDQISSRALNVDKGESDVRSELLRLVEQWKARDPERYWDDFYSPRKSLLQSAELAAAKRTIGRGVGEAWPTLNNMRNVEPATPFRLVRALSSPSKGSQEEENG